jgi:hypothetical protein
MTSRLSERAALGAMLVATLLWGGTFVAIRDSVKSLTPQMLVCGRFTVATVLFIAIALVRRRLPRPVEWRLGIGNGVLMVGAFFLQALGLRWTSAGSSAFLTCAGTLFAAFYAWLLLRQRPSSLLLWGSRSRSSARRSCRSMARCGWVAVNSSRSVAPRSTRCRSSGSRASRARSTRSR